MHGRSCVQMAHGVSQGTAVLITPAPTTTATSTTSYSIVLPSSATIPIATTRPIATASFVAGPTTLSNLLRNNSSPEAAAAREFANSIDAPSFGTENRRPSYHMRTASDTMEDNGVRFGGVSTLGRDYTIESPLSSALSSVGTEPPAQRNPSTSNHSISDNGSARGEATDAPPAALARASMSPQPEEPAPSSDDTSRPGGAGDSEVSRTRASERRGHQQQRRVFPQDLARPPPTRHAALVATRRISEAIATGGMAHFATSGSGGASSVGCGRNNGRKKHATRSSTSSAAASRAANTDVAEDVEIATPPRRRQRASRAKTDSTTDRKPASSGRKRAASSAKSGHAAKKVATAPAASPPSQEKKKSDQSCCICLDVPDLVELSSINGCAHYFCFGCIEKWADRENTCPLCKNRFTKIDRVHKQPAKRKRKGEASGGPRTKNTKKVKNRDQRADLNQGNPLQGLFASIDGNGQVNQSIAQLIFSGLNVGGISGSLMLATSNSTSGNPTSSARPSQRSQGQGRSWGSSSSASSSRGSTSASSSAADPFPVHPVPVSMGLMRRLAAGNRPDGGPGVDATGAGRSVSFGSSAPRSESSWGWSSSRRHSGPTPSVQVRFGPSSRSWSQHHSAASTAAAFVNDHHDVDSNDSDDEFNTFPNYVQRVRNLDRERQAVIERYHYSTGGSTGSSSAPSQPPPASRVAPVGTVGSGRGRVLNPLGGETADTALLIDDSDDDDDIVEVVSSFGGPF